MKKKSKPPAKGPSPLVGVIMGSTSDWDTMRHAADTLASFDGTHVGSLEPEALRSALSAAMRALLHEGEAADVPSVDAVAQRLAQLQ